MSIALPMTQGRLRLQNPYIEATCTGSLSGLSGNVGGR